MRNLHVFFPLHRPVIKPLGPVASFFLWSVPCLWEVPSCPVAHGPLPSFFDDGLELELASGLRKCGFAAAGCIVVNYWSIYAYQLNCTIPLGYFFSPSILYFLFISVYFC